MGITSPERINGKLGSIKRRKECKKNRAIKIAMFLRDFLREDENEKHLHQKLSNKNFRFCILAFNAAHVIAPNTEYLSDKHAK